ncbi:MAG: nucleoside monophosphate kinase [bacterium]|nr:nucleoside monophosphate kinase [bacterium]
MGPQGSGKSTQALKLAENLGLPYLQTGELFRKIAAGQEALAQKIKQTLAEGKLVPNEEYNQILGNEIIKPEYQNGFVIDGSPRTLVQAETLPFEPDKVFYLAVSDEENINRLSKRGREDDTPDLINKRLSLYHEQTEPVLEYYRQKNILEEIDGERSIEAIFEDIKGRVAA